MQQEVKVPDIGDYSGVEVIDVHVKVGDVVAKEDVLITLETEKAAMDIPAPFPGTITQVHVAVGTKVSQGSLILTLEGAQATETASVSSASTKISTQANAHDNTQADAQKITQDSIDSGTAGGHIALAAKNAATIASAQHYVQHSATATVVDNSNVYASPGVRRFAHTLGVNLHLVPGSGRKARILRHDVENYVRYILANKQLNGQISNNQSNNSQGVQTHSHVTGAMNLLATNVTSGNAEAVGGFSVMSFKAVDFSKFGEVETKPLARIKKISGAALHRNWVHIPHVTQFDEADITELEDFRQQQKSLAEKQGVKLTSLVFVMKAVVAGLKQFPHFNASLNLAGDSLVLKKYFHVGVAVDTPDGLVVPVVRDVDNKGILQLAAELGEISKQARDGKLTAAQMQGGCFSISSLGGIGGTAFTPIINAPEVAILGVSKAKMQQVYSPSQGVHVSSQQSRKIIGEEYKAEFVPRLILPLSLSYDHRVIDGAEAVRFTSFLVQQLADIRNLLL